MNRTLWGAVTPNLRAVYASQAETCIKLHLYFDGPISEEDADTASVAATEVLADYPDSFTLGEHHIRVDAPEPIRAAPEFWLVFKRREAR